MIDRSANCCLCGAPRRPTQAPVPSFGNNIETVLMKNHRPLVDGRWEESPQLLVNVVMWRNGGTDASAHMCDDCIVVGLTHAKQFVERALAALTTA